VKVYSEYAAQSPRRKRMRKTAAWTGFGCFIILHSSILIP